MASKILLSLSPLLSFLAPACSTNLPMDATVFSSLLNANPEPFTRNATALQKTKRSEGASFDEALRVMSFNIRWNDDPNHDWSDRKEHVVSVIRFHRPDLIGLQEPFSDQLSDLAEKLPEHALFKGACFQEGEMGAHDAIFFRKSRFDLLESGFFYLSPTPEVPSKGWDAKFPRGVTWVKLSDKKTGQTLYFFNTHFDYHSRKARDESAHLLRAKISQIARGTPFVVAGDFNLFPDLGGEATYQILTSNQPILSGRPLIDAQKAALFPHHGPTGTWSGFKEAGQPGIKPDFIFVDAGIDVLLHGVLADSFDGRFPSDHLPVVADISLH